MLPFYNLNWWASLLFVTLPLGAMVTLYFTARDFDRLVAIGASHADYLAAFLTLAVLFLSAAGSEPWARLLSKDRSRVGDTRFAALVGAGACVVFSGVFVFLGR